jgi:predicted transglutaminase-like protease
MLYNKNNLLVEEARKIDEWLKEIDNTITNDTISQRYKSSLRAKREKLLKKRLKLAEQIREIKYPKPTSKLFELLAE